jgi:histidyl-tRNA synthetase
VLAALSVLAGKPGAETDFCVAIDKLDKIGWEAVAGELQTKGFDTAAVETVKPLLQARLPWREQLAMLEQKLIGLEIGLSGLQELQQLFQLIYAAHADAQVELDFSLARGLTYYTGAIFEIKALGVAIGSISGGGRYDNLTGLFGLPDVPGVGISFGVDRIFDVMEELSLFSQLDAAPARALLVRFDDDDAEDCLKLVQQLRSENIAVELYPEPEKLKKQFTYADNLKIPFVLLFGAEERAQKKLKIKNMQTGEQQILSVEEVISLLKI